MSSVLVAPESSGNREPVSVSIRAFAVRHCPVADFAALRTHPAPAELLEQLEARGASNRKDRRNVLRHAADQTVLGVATVYQAILDFDLVDQSFADWGVLGASRFLGRIPSFEWLERFAQQGVGAASVHIIPHLSLHSLSGAVSLTLKAFGPNFGIAGGEGHMVQGLLTALTVFNQMPHLPGMWLVFTGWEPEAVPDDEGRCQPDAVCHAIALALVPTSSETPEADRSKRPPTFSRTLALHPGMFAGYAPERGDSRVADCPTITELGRFLGQQRPGRWLCPVSAIGQLELVISETGSLPFSGTKPDCRPTAA